MRLYHGGIPGLAVGDVLTGGHDRAAHQDCEWCKARAAGGAYMGQDPPSAHDAVYATSSRLYAKHYASLWGRGDLYSVELDADAEQSTEDTIETWHAPSARIVAVLDRCVLLTDSERRRMFREWTAADRAAGKDSAHDVIAEARLRRQLGMDRTPGAIEFDHRFGLTKVGYGHHRRARRR